MTRTEAQSEAWRSKVENRYLALAQCFKGRTMTLDEARFVLRQEKRLRMCFAPCIHSGDVKTLNAETEREGWLK